VSSSTLYNNSANGVSGSSGWGGGIVVNVGAATVTNSTFFGNSATLSAPSVASPVSQTAL
jgi:hypothetical protein